MNEWSGDYSLESLFDAEASEAYGDEGKDCCVSPNVKSYHQPEEHAQAKARDSKVSIATQNSTGISSSAEFSFYPVTMELRPDSIDEFLLAAEETSRENFKLDQPFCLVGLHTCGDLCSTALRLFAGIPSARALCVVGCCYHHITEIEDGHGERLRGKMVVRVHMWNWVECMMIKLTLVCVHLCTI